MPALYWTTRVSVKCRHKPSIGADDLVCLSLVLISYSQRHKFLIALTNHCIEALTYMFFLSAGSVFRPWREPAQSPNPPAPEVHTHILLISYWRWTMNLILWCSAIDWWITSLSYLSLLSYSVVSTLRLRIQPSSPPPTHPNNHLFRQPNQSPPPGSAGIMQGHG